MVRIHAGQFVGKWVVYILGCRGGRMYTGITNDIARRFKMHKSGKGGKFTRAFAAKKILYVERQSSKSAALKREAEIKRWTKEKKQTLL